MLWLGIFILHCVFAGQYCLRVQQLPVLTLVLQSILQLQLLTENVKPRSALFNGAMTPLMSKITPYVDE